MRHVDFMEDIHTRTKRDYLASVLEFPKAEAAKRAKKFGYGGYKYDGRWNILAKKLVHYYKLKAGQKVLDIGCGKIFLLYELAKEVPRN